jgi:hypothetical protein
VTSPASSATVGGGCNGALAALLSGPPQLGTTVQLGAVGGAPFVFAAAQFGDGELSPVSQALRGEPQCTLLGHGPSLAVGLTDALGASPTVPLAVPNAPALNGARVSVQPWTWIPGSLQLGPVLVLLPGS